MHVVPKPFPALPRKRLANTLAALALCALLGACGNDDAKAPDTGSAAAQPSDSSANTASVLSANPSSEAASAPIAATIQSPALPASGADATLSAATSTPLVTPVVHTVE